MMKGGMGMSVLGLVYWRTLVMKRNGNGSGNDINTDRNEGAPLGMGYDQEAITMPYL
jgi:hypothetical protein